ncbi:MAG: helix-turn-helix domain-containing protein [Candidatus Gastranaerophilales bacterium]|nr:helix-turn-helix domain-containing protein [Candidatus Gastranaerophilales bacterium]
MQVDKNKLELFKHAVGEVLKELRQADVGVSMSKRAREYEFDKGSLSKIERGVYDCRLSTIWVLCEINSVSFPEFASRLEEKLGTDFKFMDE